MTTDDCHPPDAPDELEARLARLGTPVGGVKTRQAALPIPLQAFHRHVLSAFLTEADPPSLALLAPMATELGLDPHAALSALAIADVVHTDPAAGMVSVAYPFSGWPTPHRVAIAGGQSSFAMCALDALGIPLMTRRDGRISSVDPSSGQEITVELHDAVWGWQPATTVVLVGVAASGGPCGAVADYCCPHINFHADPHAAEAYGRTHPGMASELLSQTDAAEAARRIFGGLLDPEASVR